MSIFKFNPLTGEPRSPEEIEKDPEGSCYAAASGLRSRLRQTHTFAVLPVTKATYDEVKTYIQNLGPQYAHMIDEAGNLDMHGVALNVDDHVQYTRPEVQSSEMLPIPEDQIIEIANEVHRAMPMDYEDCDELLAIIRAVFEKYREDGKVLATVAHRYAPPGTDDAWALAHEALPVITGHVHQELVTREAALAYAAGFRQVPAASLEGRVLELLLTLHGRVFHAFDDGENQGDGVVRITDAHAKSVEETLNALDELPDDRPGYVIAGEAMSRWALRHLYNPGDTEG